MKEYILEIKKVIPKVLCEKIIKYFDEDLNPATTTGYGVNKDVRNCDTRSLFYTKSFGQQICAAAVKEKILDCGHHYEKKHGISLEKISELNLLKYEKNEHKAGFNFHEDFGPNVTERHLSISICLNNEFEGGEFVFDLPGGHFTVPQNIGDAIVFPSNFMFRHSVNKITKGIRYALVSWVI